MITSPRILVISHGHPDFSLGGGEVAAYSLFKEYAQHPDVSKAFFLARIDRHRGASGAISVHADHEYLWEQQVHDFFTMAAVNIHSTLINFASFMDAIKPDIVHIHHVIHMGLEFIKVLKNVNPNIKIYFTLHEYMAICHNRGQMIKNDGMLCFKSGLDSCSRCFPEFSKEQFWQRKHNFMYYFSHIEKFIAPSNFLRQRYIEWGLAENTIITLENGMRNLPRLAPRTIQDKRGRYRFAFFGQINENKGIELLLQAITCIPKNERKKFSIEIHGANFELQPEKFQNRIRELRAPLIEEGCVQWMGPYTPDHLADRMANVDWIIVPSTWWENSPVVIQEAFAVGRPVLVSDIGGMAEKVRNGVDGLHVQAGNLQAWADTLMYACGNNKLWDCLCNEIASPWTVKKCAEAHLQMMGVHSA